MGTSCVEVRADYGFSHPVHVVRRKAGMRRSGGKGIKILAVASGGGHWDELMLLRPGFENFEVRFATTNPLLPARDGIGEVEVLPDCNRDQPIRSLRCLLASLRLIWRSRPQVLVTTGALPGLFCLVFARLLGARTIWVDSIANWDEPSLSGRLARPFASLWLTQWPHLAKSRSMLYRGALL